MTPLLRPSIYKETAGPRHGIPAYAGMTWVVRVRPRHGIPAYAGMTWVVRVRPRHGIPAYAGMTWWRRTGVMPCGNDGEGPRA